MKKHKRRSFQDIEKLFSALALYQQQQSERAFYGGQAEFEDIQTDNKNLAREVLPIIKKYLDEDLVEKLEDKNRDKYPLGWFTPPYFAEQWKAWQKNFAKFTMPVTPFGGFNPFTGETEKLNDIVAELQFNIRRKKQKAEAKDKTLTDKEISTIVADFKSDLVDYIKEESEEVDEVNN